jgi:hypothetical protein
MLRIQRAESICIINVSIHFNSLLYYEFANIKEAMPITVSTGTYGKIYCIQYSATINT